MKIFITTVGIFLLSFICTDNQGTSQSVIVDGYTINTYPESEMLLQHLVSKIKLAHNEVLLISLQQDIQYLEEDNKAHPIKPIVESWEEILHNLDSLDNEIKTPKNN